MPHGAGESAACTRTSASSEWRCYQDGGARRVGEIRRADVLRLAEEVRERGGVAFNRTLALVRVVFQFAVDHEELDAIPALRIPRRYLFAEQPREPR